MHEFMQSADDTIALRLSQKITGADLDAIMDRLSEVMAKNAKVHVYVETNCLNSIEIASLPSYITRAMSLFRQLNRFGRVAVVADQAWIRVATRIESALLPGISYRTYSLEDRDAALAWVSDVVDA